MTNPKKSSIIFGTTILLSLLAIGLNVNSVMAHLTVDSSNRIQTSLAQINDEDDDDEQEQEVSINDKKKSKLYYTRGVKAQEDGDDDAALEYYKKALEFTYL